MEAIAAWIEARGFDIEPEHIGGEQVWERDRGKVASSEVMRTTVALERRTRFGWRTRADAFSGNFVSYSLL